MAEIEPPRKRRSSPRQLSLVADVLVIGGGPAGAWAALTARKAGAEVVLVDKGFFGTTGATAPSNTETWVAASDKEREAAVTRHLKKTDGLCNPGHVARVLEEAYRGLGQLALWAYPYPVDPTGKPYLGNLRGPDYMRFMRRRVIGAGVDVRDHHPALTLLADREGVAGAEGVDRQLANEWSVRASTVVLATGGCAFGERMMGATGLTGDGLLMAVEAGARLSGMEMSSQYAVTPKSSSLNKGMPYRWATFYDADGRNMGELGDDRQIPIAQALLAGPVYARLDKASAEERDWLRRGQPNCFLPFDRLGIDPFEDLFEVSLRGEGTVRGVGGVKLASDDCDTDVAGLFAAGDIASRENLMGAITGGGGPNASWAIASGIWAGRAAAKLAAETRSRRDQRELRSLGFSGMREPAGKTSAPRAADVHETVRAHMIPLTKNFFRREEVLRRSLDELDDLWREIASAWQGRGRKRLGLGTIKTREAAAMLAVSRWSLESAIARRDSRGMHRRLDHPQFDKHAPRRLMVHGLDDIAVSIEQEAGGAGA